MSNVSEIQSSPHPVHRVAFITSHPIQYQVPLFRLLASRQEIDLTVYFCSRWGLDSYRDPGFGQRIAWDVDLLSGYRHRFLSNCGFSDGPDGFAGLINPAIASVMWKDFDAVVTGGWYTANHWITWLSAVVFRTPLLLRAESNGLSERSGLKCRLKHGLLRAMFRRIDGFLAIGTRSSDYYRSLGIPARKFTLAPYAVENERFFLAHEKLRGMKASLRAKHGMPVDRALFVFSGKLIPVKRPFDLLHAFHAAQQLGMSAALAFVGDGQLKPALEAHVREKKIKDVYFMGFKNQTEIAECYAIGDLLVLPSEHEPWGLVVNEAMCFGLAIVASNRVGSAPDLVKDGINGVTYMAGDIDRLSEWLRDLAAAPDVVARMGEESKRIVSQWGLKQGVDGIVASLNRLRGRS